MKKIILVSMFTLVFAAIGLAQPGSILSWERGRLVRIEREARKVIAVRSSKRERASHAVRTRRPRSQRHLHPC